MSAITSASNLLGQPARVLIGNPTTASGAGFVELSRVPRVDLVPTFFRQMSTNEQKQIVSDGVFGAIKGADISLQVLSSQAAILAAMFNEVTDNTTDVTFSPTLSQLSLPTMCIVPETGYGGTVTDPEYWWVPAVVPMDMTALVYKLEESEDSSEVFTVNFKAARRTSDQDSNVIATDYQILFRGDPNSATAGTTAVWSLPSGY